jgi:hypothetical protein
VLDEVHVVSSYPAAALHAGKDIGSAGAAWVSTLSTAAATGHAQSQFVDISRTQVCQLQQQLPAAMRFSDLRYLQYSGSHMLLTKQLTRWYYICHDVSCRSNLAKNFQFEELYDGDISSVQIATCKSNSEKVVVKAFKRDKLQHRVDLQHKVGA